MVEQISDADINAIVHFHNIAKKTDQTIRIYNELYAQRAQCYAAIAGKKPGFFRRMFGKISPYEQGDPFAGISNVNKREERVLGLIEGAYNEMKPYISRLSEKKWKKEKACISIMERYFKDIAELQKAFLKSEMNYFMFQKGKNSEKFKKDSKVYFDTLDEHCTLITREFKNFYSPQDFYALIENTGKQHPALKILKEQLNLIGGLTVFVGLFVSISAFNHSIPEQLFDVSKLPDAKTFLELLIIAYFLTLFDIPNKLWKGIKNNTADISRSLVLIAAKISD